jgi:hypothetical protein
VKTSRSFTTFQCRRRFSDRSEAPARYHESVLDSFHYLAPADWRNAAITLTHYRSSRSRPSRKRPRLVCQQRFDALASPTSPDFSPRNRNQSFKSIERRQLANARRRSIAKSVCSHRDGCVIGTAESNPSSPGRRGTGRRHTYP